MSLVLESAEYSSQEKFEKYLVSEYLKHGSINKVFYFHHFGLPISYAGYDRVLTKYKVIKSAGPNSKLTESLRILKLIADYKLSLEKVYDRMAPRKLLVSTNTLHRILHYTRLGLTRRQGVALIITQGGRKNKILAGRDMSLSDNKLGQKGDLTIPMGHSKIGENPKDSIARVLQQEVFTDLCLENNFPWETIPDHPKPVMFMNIADIKVSVYEIKLSKKYPLSSFKLSNLKFMDTGKIKGEKLRPGIFDILENYSDRSQPVGYRLIPEYISELNSVLFSPAKVKDK